MIFETKVVLEPVLESEWSYVLHCRWYLFLWQKKPLRLEDLNLAKKMEVLVTCNQACREVTSLLFPGYGW